jgi:prepilin-type N-terminal cleavage/methylation domain-containing protein
MDLDRHSPRPRHGVSLVELLVALTIISVVAGGLGAAVMISSRALPDPDTPALRAVETTRALEEIAVELAYATEVSTAEPTELAFTVERAGAPVGVRYTWSGTPGDPLVRTLDGGAAAVVLEAVETLLFEYDTASNPSLPGPPGVESGETLLLQQEGTPTNDYDLTSNWELAGSLLPTLPAEATSWRITRVHFVGGPSGAANGAMAVEIRPAQPDGTPSGTVVDSVVVPETDLVAGQWHEVAFADAGGLDPATPCHVVFTRGAGGGAFGTLRLAQQDPTPGTMTHESNDSGVSWWTQGWDIHLWVWGTHTVPDAGWAPPPGTRADAVTITLATSADPGAPRRSTTTLLNHPGLITP